MQSQYDILLTDNTPKEGFRSEEIFFQIRFPKNTKFCVTKEPEWLSGIGIKTRVFKFLMIPIPSN